MTQDKDQKEPVSRVEPQPAGEHGVPRVNPNDLASAAEDLSPEDLEYAAALIEGHAARHEHKWSDLTRLVIERRYLRFRGEAERRRQKRMAAAAIAKAEGR